MNKLQTNTEQYWKYLNTLYTNQKHVNNNVGKVDIVAKHKTRITVTRTTEVTSTLNPGTQYKCVRKKCFKEEQKKHFEEATNYK